MSYKGYLETAKARLAEIREAGLYEEQRVIASPQAAHIRLEDGREVINMCANNYLGLADNPEVIKAAHEALDKYGFGSASVRFIYGTQTIHKQLSVAAALAGSEEYILPMYIGEDLAKVHLTLEHAKNRKSQVNISVDISQGMHVEAHFSLQENRLQGFLVGNTREEVTKLQKAADIFLELMEQEGNTDWEISDIPVVGTGAKRNAEPNQASGATGQATNAELYRVAKLFLKAVS